MIKAGGQRGLILGLALAVLLLAAVIVANSVGTGTVLQSVPKALQTRELLFLDDSNGVISVMDAKSRTPLGIVPNGYNSFIGTTVRLRSQERARLGRDVKAPFVLTRWNDNRLSLEDPATGQRIELHAFGAPNAESFARYLAMDKRTQ